MALSNDVEDLKRDIRYVDVELRILNNRKAILERLLKDAEKNKKMEEL